jgi:hypothetical protein
MRRCVVAGLLLICAGAGEAAAGTGRVTERRNAKHQALASCRRHSQDCSVKRRVCTTR